MRYCSTLASLISLHYWGGPQSEWCRVYHTADYVSLQMCWSPAQDGNSSESNPTRLHWLGVAVTFHSSCRNKWIHKKIKHPKVRVVFPFFFNVWCLETLLLEAWVVLWWDNLLNFVDADYQSTFVKLDPAVSEILSVKLRAVLAWWWCCGKPTRFTLKVKNPCVKINYSPIFCFQNRPADVQK